MTLPVREYTVATAHLIPRHAEALRRASFAARPASTERRAGIGAKIRDSQFDGHVEAYRNILIATAHMRRLHLNEAEPEPIFYSVPALTQIVVKATGVSVEEIYGDRRHDATVRARQTLYWLCRRFTRRSISEIGRKVGDKDPTTVTHGARKVEKIIADRAIRPTRLHDPYHWALALHASDWPQGNRGRPR